MRYSLFDNLRIAFADLKRGGMRQYIYLLLNIVIQILTPFLLVLLPAKAIGMFTFGNTIYEIMWFLFWWLTGILVMNIIQRFSLNRLLQCIRRIVDVCYEYKLTEVLLNCKLKDIEGTKQQKKIQEAFLVTQGFDPEGEYAGIMGFYVHSMNFIINICGLLMYVWIAGSLNPILLIVYFSLAGMNYFVKNKTLKIYFKGLEDFSENAKKYWYLKNQAISLEVAKDIRMYGLKEWFSYAFKENTKEASEIYRDGQRLYFGSNLFLVFTAVIRDAVTYGFLILELINGKLDVSSFLLYIGIAAGFANWIDGLIKSFTYMNKCSYSISFFKDFIHENRVESKKVTRLPKTIDSIVFEDVSFGYGEDMLFNHFNLTLNTSEKVALVGVNGAGKTTLTKLLCGLYSPKEGRILINGEDIAQFDFVQYTNLISILFQEVNVLPFSIAKNVSCQFENQVIDKSAVLSKMLKQVEKKDFCLNHYEEERVVESLKKAGLYNKVKTLPNGIHTVLTQLLDAEGISLSGGEMQRLMLARAIYKNAPVLILDEPTSALDPIAESELYEEYAKLCAGKISLFISHRLSSTRFCDRILFLEDGEILEEGTHDELMDKNGKYAEMFNIQSHYYQKEVEKYEAEF